MTNYVPKEFAITVLKFSILASFLVGLVAGIAITNIWIS